jgi:hypothetical protein
MGFGPLNAFMVLKLNKEDWGLFVFLLRGKLPKTWTSGSNM